jgi:MFS family permease
VLNRNLIVLSISQIFSFTAAPITVFLSGIIGSSMVDQKSLVTLPTALMIVGTSLGSIIASYLMSKTGRKFGFMFSTIITSSAALLASYAVSKNLFIYYCLSNLLIGLGLAFTAQYRFAAAESVSKKFIPTAISIILFSSMIGALLGPNVATFTKNFISTSVYAGSYIFLSLLTIIPFFLLFFYVNESNKKNDEIILNKYSRSYFALISQPRFSQAIISSAIGYVTMSFLMTATPISMHLMDYISIGKTGIVIQIHILGMFLPSLVTGNLIKKYGHSKIMYFGVIILLFCIMINFVNQSFYNYLFGLALLGIGWNFLFISGTSLLIISYEPEEKFKSQGFNDFFVFTTQAVGALSAGYLLNIFGWQFINILCAPLLVIVIVAVYIADIKQKSITKS